MIIRTKPSKRFTVLHNAVLQDDRLSYRARGVLAAILSRPDDWRTTSELLTATGREGRDAIRRALRELEDAGYVIRRPERDPKTGRMCTVTYVFDDPQETENSGQGVDKWGPAGTGDGFPVVGKPVVGFSGPLIKTENKRQRRTDIHNMTSDEYFALPECAHGVKTIKRCPLCARNTP